MSKTLPYPQAFLLASKNLSLSPFTKRDVLLPNVTQAITNKQTKKAERARVVCVLFPAYSLTASCQNPKEPAPLNLVQTFSGPDPNHQKGTRVASSDNSVCLPCHLHGLLGSVSQVKQLYAKESLHLFRGGEGGWAGGCQSSMKVMNDIFHFCKQRRPQDKPHNYRVSLMS